MTRREIYVGFCADHDLVVGEEIRQPGGQTKAREHAVCFRGMMPLLTPSQRVMPDMPPQAASSILKNNKRDMTRNVQHAS